MAASTATPGAWMYDSPPDGLGLRRRSVSADLFASIYGASRDGAGTWGLSAGRAAAELGCSGRTVQRSLAALVSGGLVYAAGHNRPEGQRGGRAVVRYAACLGPIERLRGRRRDAALAARRLGLPYSEEDASWEPAAPACAPPGGPGSVAGGAGGACLAALEAARADGRLSDADVAAISRLMAEAPTPVDGAHAGRVVDAYLEAVEDGFCFHDMLRAVRDLSVWLDGPGRGVVVYLYVLLGRNAHGAHHKALVRARELNCGAVSVAGSEPVADRDGCSGGDALPAVRWSEGPCS